MIRDSLSSSYLLAALFEYLRDRNLIPTFDDVILAILISKSEMLQLKSPTSTRQRSSSHTDVASKRGKLD